MDVKNLVMAVVGMVLAAVMIGGAFLPAVGSAGKVTYTNDYGSMAEYSDIDWSAEMEIIDQKIKWVVDGEDQTDFMMKRSGRIYLVLSDTSYIFYDQNNSLDIPANAGISYINENGEAVNITGVTACSIVASDGTITYTPTRTGGVVSDPISIGYSWMFASNDSGDYRSLNLANFSSATLEYNSVNQIYGVNYVESAGNTWFSFNGDKVKYGLTEMDMSIESVQVMNGVYRSTVNTTDSDWSFSIEVDNEPYQVNPYVYIVPYEVIGYNDGYNPAISSMFETLPIIAVAGLVMAGIYVFISRK